MNHLLIFQELRKRFFLMFLDDSGGAMKQVPSEEQFVPFWVPSAQACDLLTFDVEKEFVRRALRWLKQRCHSE